MFRKLGEAWEHWKPGTLRARAGCIGAALVLTLLLAWGWLGRSRNESPTDLNVAKISATQDSAEASEPPPVELLAVPPEKIGLPRPAAKPATEKPAEAVPLPTFPPVPVIPELPSFDVPRTPELPKAPVDGPTQKPKDNDLPPRDARREKSPFGEAPPPPFPLTFDKADKAPTAPDIKETGTKERDPSQEDVLPYPAVAPNVENAPALPPSKPPADKLKQSWVPTKPSSDRPVSAQVLQDLPVETDQSEDTSDLPWPFNTTGDPGFQEAIGAGPRDPFPRGRAAREAQGGPLGWAGRVPVVPNEIIGSDFFPVEDRWRIAFPGWDRYVRGLPWDPYHQNVLKGDYPILGTQDLFFNFTGVSDQFFEHRRLPGKNGGNISQNLYNHNLVTTFDLFKGNNTFHPADWFLRVTPIFNVRDQTGQGTTTDVPIQEMFADVQLAIISPYHDQINLRVGRQGINSDFRGFLFVDVNDAVRLFGNADENRFQYQFFAVDGTRKDPISQLNTFDSRDQYLFGATVVRQDFLFLGLNALAGVLYDCDRFKQNVDVAYLELAADGHIGRFNVSAAFIQALGRDDFNPVAKRSVDINGQLAALEVAYPLDWLVPRVSALYAPGDRRSGDGQATGFDSVFDNPNFAGDGFSYVGRENLQPGGVPLVNNFSFYPNMRNKFFDPANFVNPGMVLLNTGFTAALTTRINVQGNLNYYRLVETEPLESRARDVNKLAAAPSIGREMGVEANGLIQYNPLIIPNVLITFGGGALVPGSAIKDLTGSSETLYMGFGALTLIF